MKTKPWSRALSLLAGVLSLALGCGGSPPLTADGAAGPVAPPPPPDSWIWVTVRDGLVRDLDVAVGTNSLGDRPIGGKLRVLAGYGVDYVALDNVGAVTAPWAAAPGDESLVVTLRGASFYPDDPSQPPHPDYAPARALFDALMHGPRTGDGLVATRDSPGGRVHCEVGQGTLYEAGCFITGVKKLGF
jgi:hypothetical protein